MNRFILNLLAGATILVGGWMLLSPSSASAANSQACCYHNGEKKCCGDRCSIDKHGQCEACSGIGCLM